MTWEEVKKKGSGHYKAEKQGDVEPLDLYLSGGILKSFALASIIKYAYRQTGRLGISEKDMEKIIHYAEILKAAFPEPLREQTYKPGTVVPVEGMVEIDPSICGGSAHGTSFSVS
jgi:hypothetical protein